MQRQDTKATNRPIVKRILCDQGPQTWRGVRHLLLLHGYCKCQLVQVALIAQVKHPQSLLYLQGKMHSSLMGGR